MLRHPFHGVIGLEANAEAVSTPGGEVQPGLARRTFFGRVLAAIAGVGGLVFSRSAVGQTGPDSRGIGFPEGGALQGGYGGGIRNPPASSSGPVTTMAVGEEGGPPPPRRRRRRPGFVTTFALGEEGGRFPPPRATTYALGEEGGYYYRR
jgi:hypothetical protein